MQVEVGLSFARGAKSCLIACIYINVSTALHLVVSFCSARFDSACLPCMIAMIVL